MDKLISANLLLSQIKEVADNHRDNIAISMLFDSFIDLVKAMPTAYDVEKTVAELEKQAMYLNTVRDGDVVRIGFLNATKAIETVKRGGMV